MKDNSPPRRGEQRGEEASLGNGGSSWEKRNYESHNCLAEKRRGCECVMQAKLATAVLRLAGRSEHRLGRWQAATRQMSTRRAQLSARGSGSSTRAVRVVPEPRSDQRLVVLHQI